ncbi:MAG: YIP1 family protein [Lachnospiraceae bacterium]|nr:YIP1 family protein [Lachnospiraceae bacterium]MBP3576967.1 YIP1 family protein [Lachnospiraceae bacterium]
MLASLKKKETYTRYFKNFKFAFYCMTHPLDGYWDLTHEKRGSMAVANTILILTLVARVTSLQFTSFIFNQVYWPEVNIFMYLGSILFPLALWVVGNWALTTLFDGKARLPQIYMATCYAMLPYPLFQFPLIIFSNMVTVNEAEFYGVINTVVLVFCAIYIVVAMMQIHEYTMKKTILFTFFSIFAMLVIVFILLLFFSMISQGIAYFVSIVREILFRM